MARIVQSATWSGATEDVAVCDSSREVYTLSDPGGDPSLVRGRFVDGRFEQDAGSETLPFRSPGYRMALTTGRIFVNDAVFERHADGSIGAFLGRTGIEGRPLDDTHLVAGTEAAPELYDVSTVEAPRLIASLLVRDDASTGRPPHGIRDFAIQGDRVVLLSEDHHVLHTMASADLLSIVEGDGRVILNDRFEVTTARATFQYFAVYAASRGRFLAPIDNPFVFTGTRPPPVDFMVPVHAIGDSASGELIIDHAEDLGCPLRGDCLPNLNNFGERYWVARGDFVFVMAPATRDVFSTTVIDLDSLTSGTPRAITDWLRDPDGLREDGAPIRQVCAAPGERVGLVFAHAPRATVASLSRFEVR